MKVRVLLVSLSSFLAGCSFEIPAFDSGNLESHALMDGCGRATVSDLAPEQLSAIAAWFSAHQAGWKKSYVDAAPAKFAHLSRAGNPVAYFNLSGDMLYAASYSRVLTTSEEQSLEAILSSKKSSGTR